MNCILTIINQEIHEWNKEGNDSYSAKVSQTET